MKNSEIEKVKAFASRDTDRARMAYDRAVTEARRQCVIIGTTNSRKYLRDLTGNRRFWPVGVGRFDLEALKRDRDQLWTEAAAREATGASIRLPEELWPAAAAEQQQRMVENPFLSVLERALRDDGDRIEEDGEKVGKPMQGKIAVEDVWTLVGLRDQPGRRTQPLTELLGAAMRQLGWTRPDDRQRAGGGEHKYCYIKGEKPYRLIEVDVFKEIDSPLQTVARYADALPPIADRHERG
jgi:predicted P-loop ATPase